MKNARQHIWRTGTLTPFAHPGFHGYSDGGMRATVLYLSQDYIVEKTDMPPFGNAAAPG